MLHYNKIRFLLILFSIVFLFNFSFFSNKAEAAIQQTDFAVTSTALTIGTDFRGVQKLGTNLSGYVDSVRLKYDVTSGNTSLMRLHLCPTLSSTTTVCDYSNEQVFVSIGLSGTSTGQQDFTYTTSSGNLTYASLIGGATTTIFTFSPTKYYIMIFNTAGGNPTAISLNGTSNANNYLGGNYLRYNNSTGTSTEDTLVKDIYFVIQGNSSTTNNATISYNFPINGSTSAAFSNWVFQLTDLIPFTTYYIHVDYQASTTDSFYQTIYNDYSSVVTNSSTNITWSIPLTNPTVLYNYPNNATTSQIWNTSVTIGTDATFSEYDSGAAISFVISPTSTAEEGNQLPYGYIAQPFISFNSIGQQFVSSSTFYCQAPNNITDIGGGIAYGLCSAGKILFDPNPNTVEYVFKQFSKFQTVFPFSLYFGIVPEVEDIITNANTATTTPLTLSVKGYNGQNIQLISLTSSTLKNAFISGGVSNASATQAVSNLFLPMKIGIWITTGLKIISMIVAL